MQKVLALHYLPNASAANKFAIVLCDFSSLLFL